MSILSAIISISFIFFVVVIITFPIWSIVLCAIDEAHPEVFLYIREKFTGEVMEGDKKRVKDGTAFYITCETYMELHKANPEAYPLFFQHFFGHYNSPWEEIRDRHNAVFTPKEASKLRKEIKKRKQCMRIQETKRQQEADRAKHQKAVNETMKSAEKMLKELKNHAEAEDEKLKKSLDESAKIIENMKR